MGELFTALQSAKAANTSFQGEQIADPNWEPPSYMQAADIHNIANNNLGLKEAETSFFSDVPKFVAASLISGGAQLYNIAPSIGNMLGGDFEEADISEVMKAFDDDIAKYYEGHKTAVDAVGFMASSLVPGLAGVKALRAAQMAGVTALESAMATGRVGATTGKALGLLAPSKEKYLSAAIKELTNSEATFTLMNRNVMRSLGAGFGQNVLEAAAFETAVFTAMSTSPVLEGQDVEDVITNIAVGGLVFGAVGGVIDATKSVFAIKGAIKDAAKEAMPWTHYEAAAKGSSPEERLAIYWEQANNIQDIPKGLDADRVSYLQKAAGKKKEALLSESRRALGELAGGDQQLAEQMFTLLKQSKPESALQNLVGLKGVSKIGERLALADKYEKAIKKVKRGETLKEEEFKLIENTRVAYVQAWGEEAGKFTDAAPTPVTLADHLKKGEQIFIDDAGVVVKNAKGAAVKKFMFKGERPWSIHTASIEEVNARYLWADKQTDILKVLGKKAPEEVIVLEQDIPMLELMYKSFKPGMKIKKMNDDVIQLATKEDALREIKAAKVSAALELAGKQKPTVMQSAEAAEAKLRNLTGVNFIVEDAEALAKRFKISIEEAKKIRGFRRRYKTGESVIGVNKEDLTKVPLYRLVQTLKHEEGHTIYDSIEQLAPLGSLPKETAAAILKEAEEISKKIRPELWKNPDKYEYVSKIHELMADTFSYLSQNVDKMAEIAPTFAKQFGHLVKPIPKESLAQFAKRTEQLNQEQIAAIVNMRNKALSGLQSQDETRDLFAMQSLRADYTTAMAKKGLHDPAKGEVDILTKPRWIKMAYDTTPVKDVDGNVLKGMAVIKQRQREYLQSTDRAVVSVLGKDAEKLVEITDKDVLKANPLGAGAGIAAAASSNYGSLAAKVEYLGNVTTGLIEKFQNITRDQLNPALIQLAQNEKAVIEWSTLSAKLRSIPDQYVLNKEGDALIPRVLAEYEAKLAAGKKPKPPEFIAPDAPKKIPLDNQEVRELARLHIAINDKRVRSLRTLFTAQGAEYRAKEGVFYPPPVNPRDYPYFAIVEDTSVTGIGRKKTIYANSEQELSDMISKLDSEPTLKINTKGETERYYKDIDEFNYEDTLHDRFLDSTLQRKGVSAPYFVATDAKKVTSDLLNWHLKAEAQLVRGAVKIKYDKQFTELHHLGNRYTNIATSKYGDSSLLKHSDEVIKNPYAGYERTALGLRNYQDYPWWTNPNRQLDALVSKMYNTIAGIFESSRSLDDLERINATLEEYGYKGAHYDMRMEALANHTAPRGALSNFVAKANAILATVVLRLDVLNAVNNTVGANVLLGSETKAVLRALEKGNKDALGELAELAYITVPGTGDKVLSATKLIANAVKKFGNDAPEMQFYKENRFITSISDQYKWTLDHLTLEGTETVAELNGKLHTVYEKLRSTADTGEKWTGNRLAEEFNRFVAADVMKQITDIGVKHGVITAKEQLAYINTFVNRTQGNYLAAQRPMMFQGPIGQAIGLFQTYQFNLMQQLLRHIGEGSAKDASTLLALQGTIYGINGLPGFNAINTHIIGTASGNDKHRDLYDVAYGIAGKEAGDWLMYGVASNMLLDPDLKINLYVRGDINPRHLTLVPVDPASVPIVQASYKFFKNLKNTYSKLEAGGDPWTTILQGIEHNGVSRPLAGLAQTLQAFANDEHASYSTSKRGNVIASNDLLSLANMARIIGGKPLDEALVVDAAYRYKVYGLKDSERLRTLGQAIKTTLIAGQQPTEEQMEYFTQRYAELGGEQQAFNRWVTQLYKTANTSQANKIAQDLNSPFSKSMQRLMGGYELRDFAQ